MKVKVKDFNPKYEIIELAIYSERYLIVELQTLKTLKRNYGEYYVYTYKVFEDTKSISVIIGKEPLYDCEEDTTPHWKI